ncbi:MAG: flavin reductase family protein [Thaumarchaeota archaeon]|nr:flavin reductase family protein [Candidatus Calditenuaceae archaeon]MDW8042065.1 flavin reductase family protein [Nitrososphaerota archaeon]
MSQPFRRALRTITYGLYVLTVRSGDEVSASTINFLTQTSLDPPLVVVALKRDSRTQQLADRAGSFALNVLASDQKQVAADFFKPTRVEGDSLNGHRTKPSRRFNHPVLEEAAAWFECRVVQKVDIGDHVPYLAEAVDGEVVREVPRYLVMWDTGWYYGG